MANETLISEPIFDKADLLARLDGDEELFSEIVEVFLSEGPGQIEDVVTALQKGEASVIERSAHGLKGAAGNIGAVRLRRVAHRIEAAARRGDASAASALGDALEREYRALSAELTGILKGRGDADE